MAGKHRLHQPHPIRTRIGLTTAAVALGLTGGVLATPVASADAPITPLASVSALPTISSLTDRDDHHRGGQDDPHFRGRRDDHHFRGNFCPRFTHWSPWLHRCVR